MIALQKRIQEENSTYRKIWIQYANYRGKYSVVITLFSYDNTYRMLFGTINDLNYESINNLFLNLVAH